jgi:hypothetical protein
MLKLFTIPLVIAMLTSLAEVNFAQLGEQISENYALILENAENAPKPPPNQNSQGNQNNQGGNSQGGGGRGGSGGHSQPPEDPMKDVTVELVTVWDAPVGSPYPSLTVIKSRQELEAYYNENNHPSGNPGIGTLDRNSRGISGGRTFREAMDSHDDAYFEENVLVIVSGRSLSFCWVESVDFSNSVIHIVRWWPLDSLDISVTWHFLIGFPKNNMPSEDFTVSWTEEYE